MADNKTSIVLTAEDKASAVINKVGGALGGLANPAAAASAALSSLAGGAALAGLGAIAKSAIDTADGLNDLSQRTGIAVKDLAAYKLAAEQSGTSLDSVAKGVKGLSKAMLDNNEALTAAGITAKDANGALRQLADLFSQIPDGPEKLAVGTKLLGKSFQELIPLLNLGSEGLDESAKASKRYADAMAVLAPQADRFNDELAKISIAGQALGAELAQKIVPGMTDIAAAMALAAQESGVLKAALVGFGGIADKALNPFAVTLKGLKAELLLFAAEWDELRAKVTFGSVKENAIKSALQNRRDASAVLTELAAMEQKPATDTLAEKTKPSDDVLKRWKSLAAAMRDTGKAVKEYDTIGESNRALQKFLEDDLKMIAKWKEAQADWERELTDLYRDSASAAQDELKALTEKANAAELENAGIGATAEQLQLLISKRYDEQIALKQSRLDLLDGQASRTAEADAIRAQITELERLKNAEIARPALEKQARAWENFSRDIEQSLTDALMRSFESGDSFGEAFVKNLQNTLKSAVLKVVVQAIVDPITGQGGLLQQGAQALGFNTGGAGNLASAGNSIYNLATGGGFLGGFSAGAASVASEFALGSAFVGPSATLAGGAVGAGASAAAATGSAAGAGALSSIGTALPYVGAALAVASLFGGDLFGGKELPPHYHLGQNRLDAGLTSPYGNQFVDAAYNKELGWRATPFSLLNIGAQHVGGNEGAVGESIAKQILDPIVALDEALAKLMDQSDITRIADTMQNWLPPQVDDPSQLNSYMLERLNQITDAFGGWVGDLADTVAGDLQTAYAQVAGILASRNSEGAQQIAEALLGDTASEFLRAGETAATAFGRLLTSLSAVNDVLDNIDMAALDLSLSGASAASALVDLFGGIDTFAAKTAAFYEGYYSPEEQAAKLAQKVEAAFADIDLAMPDTRAEFRAMVDALDLTSEAGRETFAATMNLAPTFGVVADAAAKAAAQQQSWRDKILALVGGDAVATRQEMERDLATATDDATRSLIRQYYAMLRASEASAELAERMEAQRTATQDYQQSLLNSVVAAWEAGKQALMDTIAQMDQFTDSMLALKSSLAVSQESPLSGASAYGIANANFVRVSEKASLGDATAIGQLSSAINDLLTASKDRASTGTDYARDFARGMAAIDTVMRYSASMSAQASADLGTIDERYIRFGRALQAQFASLPAYADGTAFVPRDQIAIVHEGERIIPAADNRALMDAMNGNNVIDITPLLDEIAALRAEVRAGNSSIAGNTRQSKDLLDSVINGGNTIRTEAVA